jgi:hypothetical protein
VSTCPYCRREAPADLATPLLLSPRRRRIYSRVAAAGAEGVASSDLIAEIWPGEPPQAAATILRVQIHAANKVLRLLGQRIRSNHCRGYVLTELAQAS